MRYYLTIFLHLPFLLLSQNTSGVINKKLPNDIRWFTESDEYQSICEQTYDIALTALNNDFQHKINPIIIMDIDETVLDNSRYQVELFIKDTQYNEATWNTWVKKELSELVPGAKNFILHYKNHPNARIVYISNRSETTLEATQNNMKKLGIYFENDIFLLRQNKSDTKVLRRKEVLNGINRMALYGPQKVIAYFGDAMGDFPNSIQYQFAKTKFIFPNPMYGKWQK